MSTIPKEEYIVRQKGTSVMRVDGLDEGMSFVYKYVGLNSLGGSQKSIRKLLKRLRDRLEDRDRLEEVPDPEEKLPKEVEKDIEALRKELSTFSHTLSKEKKGLKELGLPWESKGALQKSQMPVSGATPHTDAAPADEVGTQVEQVQVGVHKKVDENDIEACLQGSCHACHKLACRLSCRVRRRVVRSWMSFLRVL